MADGKTSSTIDFTKLSQTELIAALGRINRERFPANYEACVAEIKNRKEQGIWTEEQSPPIQEKSQTPKLIAGFWIRAAADIIDLAILWAFALALGLVLEPWFVKMGENGIWLGLLISMAYFVPTQSTFGNGQSLGKRILGIQVLDVNGQALTLTKSFLRYVIIAFVGYFGVFSGIVNLISGPTFYIFADSILEGAWFIAFVGCYLLLPLHPLKRGLHDLVANSIVVYRGQFNTAAIAKLDNPTKAKKAFAIIGAVFAVTVVIGIWSFVTITKNSAVNSGPLQELQNNLESTGKLSAISVTDKTSSNRSGTTRSIIVHAYVAGPLNQTRKDLKPLYDLAFQTIRNQIKDLSPYNNLRVGLRFGYNIGIRKRYTILFQDENPSNPGERRDAGSSSNF